MEDRLVAGLLGHAEVHEVSLGGHQATLPCDCPPTSDCLRMGWERPVRGG